MLDAIAVLAIFSVLVERSAKPIHDIQQHYLWVIINRFCDDGPVKGWSTRGWEFKQVTA